MRISDWSSDVCSSRSQALMKALIERRIAAEDGRIGEIEARLGPVPDVAIRARLASELRDLTDEDRSVALSLCALVAQDADLRAPIQEMMRRRIAKVLETSTQPRDRKSTRLNSSH